jgi:Protein of unknown function (DUF1565).
MMSCCLTHAATYYVTKSGSDWNSCTQAKTEVTARLTINAGVRCLASGDVLIVASGVYNEALNDVIPSGRSGYPTTIKAKTAGTVTVLPLATPSKRAEVIKFVDDSYILIQGLIIDGVNVSAVGIRFMGNSKYSSILSSTIRNAPLDAIFFQDLASTNNTVGACKIYSIGTTTQHQGIYVRSNNNVIEDSEFYDISGYAIQAYSSSRSISGNIIRRNVIRDSPQYRGGILVGCDYPYTASNNKIYNNLIYRNLRGIELYNYGSGNKIWNNTLYSNGSYGITVASHQSSTEIKNNIIYYHSAAIVNSGGSTVQASNVTTNPSFVDSSRSNFRLKTGSPAIDSGKPLTEFTNDLEKLLRPFGGTWDIGAYEYRLF